MLGLFCKRRRRSGRCLGSSLPLQGHYQMGSPGGVFWTYVRFLSILRIALKINFLSILRLVTKVCIQRWVDEKQKGNNSTGVVCPQCGADYIIQVTVKTQQFLNQLTYPQFPASPPFLRLLDALDKLVHLYYNATLYHFNFEIECLIILDLEIEHNSHLQGGSALSCDCRRGLCRLPLLDLRHIWGCHRDAGARIFHPQCNGPPPP